MNDADVGRRRPAVPDVVGRLLRTPTGVIGIALTVLVVGTAVFAETIAPFDPFAPIGPALSPPSGEHLMGTDDLGRDVFSGVVFGARASLILAAGVATLVAIIGLTVGTVSGYGSPTTDDVLMRITEAFQVLPRFFLAIVVVALFGAGLDRLVVVLGVTSWAIVARVVRAEILSLREEEFVDAARALGAGDVRIVVRHLVPSVLPATTTFVTLVIAQAILIEASLGFLGLSDPSVMSWGILAGNAQRFLRVAWWLALFPGAAITIAVLGVNLLGDAVSDVLRGRETGRTGATRSRTSDAGAATEMEAARASMD